MVYAVETRFASLDTLEPIMWANIRDILYNKYIKNANFLLQNGDQSMYVMEADMGPNSLFVLSSELLKANTWS